MGGKTSFNTIVNAMKIVASARIRVWKIVVFSFKRFLFLRQYYLVQVLWVDSIQLSSQPSPSLSSPKP